MQKSRIVPLPFSGLGFAFHPHRWQRDSKRAKQGASVERVARIDDVDGRIGFGIVDFEKWEARPTQEGLPVAGGCGQAGRRSRHPPDRQILHRSRPPAGTDQRGPERSSTSESQRRSGSSLRRGITTARWNGSTGTGAIINLGIAAPLRLASTTRREIDPPAAIAIT